MDRLKKKMMMTDDDNANDAMLLVRMLAYSATLLLC